MRYRFFPKDDPEDWKTWTGDNGRKIVIREILGDEKGFQIGYEDAESYQAVSIQAAERGF
jgi:hypothetical protein